MRAEIMKLNEVSKNGFKVIGIKNLPEQVKVYETLSDEYDVVGKATDFRIEGNCLTCDITFTKDSVVKKIKHGVYYAAPCLHASDHVQEGEVCLVKDAEIKYIGLTRHHSDNNIKPLVIE